jgi:hypothetical protein
MNTLELTSKELNDLVVGTIMTLTSAKKKTYEPTFTDSDGLIYDTQISKEEWEANRKKYINRITKLRKKLTTMYEQSVSI